MHHPRRVGMLDVSRPLGIGQVLNIVAMSQEGTEIMRHEVWTYDSHLMMTISKPQDWNHCRYCGVAIADTHNVPVCDSCYPQYHFEEKELYIHGRDKSLLEARFDPQTGQEGSETFHPEGWKYLDTTDGYQRVRDFVR